MKVIDQLFVLLLVGFAGMMAAGFYGHRNLAITAACLTTLAGITYAIKAID